MMQLSAEIRKYYWQDFSTQRLIAMPAVMLAVVWLFNMNPFGSASAIGTAAAIAYFLLVFIWGGYKAASGVVEEIQGNTWDNQRLSSVSPWHLSLGKLFGSTLYTWYGALIALAIYVVAGLKAGSPVVFYNASLWLFSGMFCHAVAMLVSVQALRMRSYNGKFHPILYLILALVASQMFYGYGSDLADAMEKGRIPAPVQWFGFYFDSATFVFVSLCIFFFWAVIGNYRLMREELKFKNGPWIWAAFVIFLMGYIAGFIYIRTDVSRLLGYDSLMSQSRLGVAFMIGIACTYAMFFSDTLNITRYRILWHQFQKQQWRKLSETVPLWVITLAICVPVAVMFIASALVDEKPMVAIVFAIGVFLFLARDACILHYFTFAPGSKRAAAATMFYLAILYFLLPSLFFAAKSTATISMFYPVVTGEVVDLFPAIVQAGIALWVLQKRYQRISAQVEKSV